MRTFNVPTTDQVSENNQAIFNNLKGALGFIPNLYATYAHNETALADYLALQNRKSTLIAKEKEVVNLVVSQINECAYCLAAHTALGKMNGFTEDQILEIREGSASWDHKLDALAKYVKSAVIHRSKPEEHTVDALFEAGYTNANLVDIIMMIGDKMISNFIHGTTQIPVDFPAAPALEYVS
jgi:uncharacterized peroxidase-related enzyme